MQTPSTAPTSSLSFAEQQLAMTHIVGHPKLAEMTTALASADAAPSDPVAYLLEHGIIIPTDTQVEVYGPGTDSPHSYTFCFAGDGAAGGHYDCWQLTLPSLTHTTS